jgi:hypothetical protein
MDPKEQRYLNRINAIIIRNPNVNYNLSVVEDLLELPRSKTAKEGCKQIMEWIKKQRPNNKYLQVFMDKIEKIGDHKSLCKIIIDALYKLFEPNLSYTSVLTDEEYQNQLKLKKHHRKMSPLERKSLKEELNIKYCACIKKLYLRQLFKKNIVGKDISDEANPWALCGTSVFLNRGFKIPKKISMSCRRKYKWYDEKP